MRMSKKCIICGKEAEYSIKHSNEYYCKECTLENFGDVSYLEKLEKDAQALKQYVKDRMTDSEIEDDE